MPSREHRRVLNRCQGHVRRYADLPRPIPMDRLVTRVAEERGRPIRVMHVAERVGAREDRVSGMWVALAEEDVLVVLGEGVEPLQRTTALLHELGHLVMDHPCELARPGVMRHLTPLLADTGAVEVLLARHRRDFNVREELEAETFARLLLSRVASDAPRVPVPDARPDTPVELVATVQRLSRAIGGMEGLPEPW